METVRRANLPAGQMISKVMAYFNPWPELTRHKSVDVAYAKYGSPRRPFRP